MNGSLWTDNEHAQTREENAGAAAAAVDTDASMEQEDDGVPFLPPLTLTGNTSPPPQHQNQNLKIYSVDSSKKY